MSKLISEDFIYIFERELKLIIKYSVRNPKNKNVENFVGYEKVVVVGCS